MIAGISMYLQIFVHIIYDIEMTICPTTSIKNEVEKNLLKFFDASANWLEVFTDQK